MPVMMTRETSSIVTVMEYYTSILMGSEFWKVKNCNQTKKLEASICCTLARARYCAELSKTFERDSDEYLDKRHLLVSLFRQELS